MGRLSPCRGLPVVFPNAGAVAAVPDSNRGIILLGHINTIWEIIVGSHPVELGRRLVIIGTPCGAAVIGNLGPTIIANDHAIRVLR